MAGYTMSGMKCGNCGGELKQGEYKFEHPHLREYPIHRSPTGCRRWALTERARQAIALRKAEGLGDHAKTAGGS